MNALDPTLMMPYERIAELAGILALGVVRLRLRQLRQLSADCGETSLDFTVNQSGCARVESRAETAK